MLLFVADEVDMTEYLESWRKVLDESFVKKIKITTLYKKCEMSSLFACRFSFPPKTIGAGQTRDVVARAPSVYLSWLSVTASTTARTTTTRIQNVAVRVYYFVNKRLPCDAS